MLEVKAPNKYNSPPELTIFLAGSIEMGKAVDWQTRVVNSLKDTNYTLLNPRRSDWDSSWVQSINNAQFSEQVNWELDGLEYAGTVIFYFDPIGVAPISLLELGKVAELMKTQNKSVLVCCPVEFSRKGNVEIVCQRAGITLINDLDTMIDFLKVVKTM